MVAVHHLGEDQVLEQVQARMDLAFGGDAGRLGGRVDVERWPAPGLLDAATGLAGQDLGGAEDDLRADGQAAGELLGGQQPQHRGVADQDLRLEAVQPFEDVLQWVAGVDAEVWTQGLWTVASTLADWCQGVVELTTAIRTRRVVRLTVAPA